MKDKTRWVAQGLDRSGEHAADASIAAVRDDDTIAALIEAVAARSDIPLVQGTLLTDLLSKAPNNDEIPENLYISIAEILSYLYRIDESVDSRE